MDQMAWYIPLLIFLARICDVSIGTVRTILVIAGNKWLSPLLGFVEVIIWVLAIGGVIRYLDNVWALLGYGAGFAAGVYIGMMIEARLALGYRMVRVVYPDSGGDLSRQLRERGYRVTRVQGSGRDGPVEIAFMVVRRKAVHALRQAIAELAPRAFLTVERVERPSGGGWEESRFGIRPWSRMIPMRK